MSIFPWMRCYVGIVRICFYISYMFFLSCFEYPSRFTNVWPLTISMLNGPGFTIHPREWKQGKTCTSWHHHHVKRWKTVYRKPTHTDRYLDYNSHHQQKRKASTARTLILRALTLRSTEEGRTNKLVHVKNALRTNNYPLRTINKIVAETKSTHPANLSPEELVGSFFKMVDPPTLQRYTGTANQDPTTTRLNGSVKTTTNFATTIPIAEIQSQPI